MRLGKTDHQITYSKGEWWYAFNGGTWKKAEEDQVPYVREIRKAFKDSSYSDEEKMRVLKFNMNLIEGTVSNDEQSITYEEIKRVAGQIINFFSEFSFEPNFRFINTMSLITKNPERNVRDYVISYFELIDSPYATSVAEKMKSEEFSKIIDNLVKVPTNTKINKRFKLYYGSQGTGKTTAACKESEGLCMVCHSATLPSDLMEDFKFIDGKATFSPSVLWNAMVEGKTIVLDEINLLPFESQRFLQSVLDGKKEFSYKGQEVVIAEGFKIIGTMNLIVNGCTYPLPEPLIDRAEDLVKFKLTAESLVEALI